jgi:hypothetical protein
MKAKADYNDDTDHFGEQPRPCPCGGLDLRLAETQPKTHNYPARVAVECAACKDRGVTTRGIDTCHGKAHAIRRWNWYPPELNELDRPPNVL